MNAPAYRRALPRSGRLLHVAAHLDRVGPDPRVHVLVRERQGMFGRCRVTLQDGTVATGTVEADDVTRVMTLGEFRNADGRGHPAAPNHAVAAVLVDTLNHPDGALQLRLQEYDGVLRIDDGVHVWHAGPHVETVPVLEGLVDAHPRRYTDLGPLGDALAARGWTVERFTPGGVTAALRVSQPADLRVDPDTALHSAVVTWPRHSATDLAVITLTTTIHVEYRGEPDLDTVLAAIEAHARTDLRPAPGIPVPAGRVDGPEASPPERDVTTRRRALAALATDTDTTVRELAGLCTVGMTAPGADDAALRIGAPMLRDQFAVDVLVLAGEDAVCVALSADAMLRGAHAGVILRELAAAGWSGVTPPHHGAGQDELACADVADPRAALDAVERTVLNVLSPGGRP